MHQRIIGLLSAAFLFAVVLIAALVSTSAGTLAAAPDAAVHSAGAKAPVDKPAAPSVANWTDIAPFPTATIDHTPVAVPLKLKRAGAAGYFPNGRLYVLGGRHGADGEDTTMRNIWEYNPGANTWAQKSALLDQSAVGSRWTANMAVAVLTDTNGVRIYAIGGSTIDSAITGTVRIYNPVADTLSTLTTADYWPASPARIPGGYAVHNNKLYIFGGFSALGTGAVFADTWVFDPMGAVGAKWSQIGTAPLSLARGYIAGTTLDGKIYAVGGDTWNPSSRVLVPQTIVERLDPSSGSPSWTTVASLPSARGDMGAWSQNTGSGTYIAGNIVVAGGVYPVPDAKAFIYSVASNTWSPFEAALNHATRNYAPAQLNNILYAFGGYDYSANIPDGANFNQRLDATGAPPTATNTPVNSPTPTNTPFSTNYSVCSFSGAVIDPGITLVPGSTCSDEDCVVTVTLPFPYTLYDQSFTSARLAINGNLGFVIAEANAQALCLPDPGANWAIFGYWDDLTTTGGGQGIFTSVTGVAPNRVFNIEWRASRTRTGTGTVNFEIRLFEGQTNFEIVYGTVAGAGNTAVVGVQRDTGSSLFTQYTCLTSGGLSNGQRLFFTLGPGLCPTPTNTLTPSQTPTPTISNTPTISPTPTISNTPTISPTRTNTQTSTPTVTGTPPTPTNTPVCSTNTYASTDVPRPIPDVSTVTSTLTIPGAVPISDLNASVALSHTFIGDLEISLTSPNNTTIRLYDNHCGSNDNLSLTFDDAAAAAVGTSCAAPYVGTFRPFQALTGFNGQSTAGTWTLTITDTAGQDVGTLNSWSLQITSGACGATNTPTNTRTRTPTNTATRTNTPTATITNTHTPTATPTTITFVGHVTIEGRPAQPDGLQSVPVSLTLQAAGGGPTSNYGTTTDQNGVFTVTMGGPPGTYDYKVKNPMTLSNAGTVSIAGGPTPQEMGMLREGDANDDNCVEVEDFNIMLNTFGRSSGDPQFDPTADFDGSGTVEVGDFNLLTGNFGTCGDELP